MIRLLEWDEETYRPAGAADSRASQLAVVDSVRHELLADARLGDLMASVAARGKRGASPARGAAPSRAAAQNGGRVARESRRRIRGSRSHCLAAWEHARAANDFAAFAKPFALLLKLIRERAEALKLGDDLYDALLDEHEPGMRRERLDPLLRTTGDRLRTLVPEWTERTRRDAALAPRGDFAENAQLTFCNALLADMGFDLDPRPG